jgi:hypothetical protein
VFQKFDDAVRAHGDGPGLIKVDIGLEVREHFPELLQTEAQMREDMGMSSAPELDLKYGTPDWRPTPRKVENGPAGRLVRVYVDAPANDKLVSRRTMRDKYATSRMKPLFKSVTLREAKKKGEFKSKWRSEPNTFAWELMEKQLQAKIQRRLKARLERTDQGPLLMRKGKYGTGEGEGEVEEDRDYDLEERRIERRLDRLGIRQPSVKRMDLDELQRERELEEWEREGDEQVGMYTPHQGRKYVARQSDRKDATSSTQDPVPWDDAPDSNLTAAAEKTYTLEPSKSVAWTEDRYPSDQDAHVRTEGGRRWNPRVRRMRVGLHWPEDAQKSEEEVERDKEREKLKLKTNILRLLGKL